MSLPRPTKASRFVIAILWLLSGVPSTLPVAPAVGTSLAVAAIVLGPADADARSSGGYSRPSSGFSSSRTPSFSGGYSRPRTPSIAPPSYRTPSFQTPQSAGDRALSRSGSADALGRYRQQQDRSADSADSGPMTLPPSSGRGGFTIPSPGGGSYGGGWYAGRGWSPPPYAYSSPPQFGMWNALFLWFLLDHLNQPGYGRFFYDHQNDPGYQQWRQDADRRAQSDPGLRDKLTQLDDQVAARQGQPRDSNYVPPGVPTEAAMANARPAESGGGLLSWIVPLLLIGVLVVLWRARHRIGVPRPGMAYAGGASPANPTRGGQTVNPFTTVANILRRKASDQPYAPSLFRVGMVMTIDPASFLLATGATKVVPPAEGGKPVSVEAVGRLSSGSDQLVRLHLPGGRGFFQLHLGAGGQPDECRYFSVIDEVDPADENEWAFWLDDHEGMIGWPEFQTKDGKVYPRAWTPGSSKVPPRDFQETVETVQAMSIRSLKAMLYAASTGAAEPAPATEYILVSSVEEDGRAWVEIAAGIDVNPATLSLS